MTAGPPPMTAISVLSAEGWRTWAVGIRMTVEAEQGAVAEVSHAGWH